MINDNWRIYYPFLQNSSTLCEFKYSTSQVLLVYKCLPRYDPNRILFLCEKACWFELHLYNVNFNTVCTFTCIFSAVRVKVFGRQLPEDGDQPKHVAARCGEIYIQSVPRVKVTTSGECSLC